ncbi:hypothetical protein [Sphingobium yanoikuyae]|uniref:pPIWI-associating nuclease domain-containing protein n=1 Tax=Sphingobium yanoikuyae TaxID=13690 RepID=UPI00207BA6D9|nr:hypothetical protein [Sphingobium yanoikuyae]
MGQFSVEIYALPGSLLSGNQQVTDMDANTIYYEVTGSVVVELQYGSGSDVANDIGSRDTDEYPYEAEIELPISDPLTVTASDVRVKVDTSSFYK